MLVLSRKVDERIMIGDNIIIHILEIRGGRWVRIGIEAPTEVAVHREEVHRDIQREQAGE